MAAKAVAEAFLKRTSGLVQSRTQLLDGNQLSKLALTIASQARQGLDADQVPENGTGERWGAGVREKVLGF